ncbi:MAG: acyl carrier protein [Eubacteriales bacterium]
MIEKVKDILAKQLRIEVDTIEDDTNIMEDLGADSLDIVELLMAIEENFGITVPDEDVSTLKTVRDIAEYVEKNS